MHADLHNTYRYWTVMTGYSVPDTRLLDRNCLKIETLQGRQMKRYLSNEEMHPLNLNCERGSTMMLVFYKDMKIKMFLTRVT